MSRLKHDAEWPNEGLVISPRTFEQADVESQ
jgi:hypothetical protein